MTRMKGLQYIAAGLLLGSALLSAARAQDKTPTVRARLSADTILIGDQPTLKVSVEKDVAQVIAFPEFQDGRLAPPIEILSMSPIDTVKEGRRETISVEYTLTSFDAGNYKMGGFPVLYLDKNVIDTLFSADTLALFVKTIEIDTTTQMIADIKPVLKAPLQFAEIKNYVFIGLAILILAALIVWLILRRRKKQQESEILLPPHVVAIGELEKLNHQKLWQSGKHKQYYTRLTDIVRDYIARRYGINAKEQTSDETLMDLREKQLSTQDGEMLRDLLTLSDLVKFAKLVPAPEENESAYDNAYHFVEDTKEVIVPETASETDPSKKEK